MYVKKKTILSLSLGNPRKAKGEGSHKFNPNLSLNAAMKLT